MGQAAVRDAVSFASRSRATCYPRSVGIDASGAAPKLRGRFRRTPKDGHGQPIDLEPIANLLVKVVDEVRPTQIWLFGSRARGDSQQESDWDILVVTPDDVDDATFDPRFAWRLRKAAQVRADIFFCRARDFVEDSGTVNTVLFDVASDGVLRSERLIANFLRVAREDLSGAELLAFSGNRNAIYLCAQAAEKLIRAVLTSENKHGGIKHQLQDMVDMIPDENPLKVQLRKIESL